MIAQVVQIVVVASAFALFTYAGSLIAATAYAKLPNFADGPQPHAPPVNAIVAAAAVLGAFCAARNAPPTALAIIALVCAVMAAIWYTDMQHGIIPDALTLIPLGAVVLGSLFVGHWGAAIAAVVPALPFAILAWRTKGVGMGWGDVKLAALGGALIGMQDAMLAFAIAGIVAVVVTKLRGDAKAPLAFAPYMASAIVVPMVLHSTL